MASLLKDPQCWGDSHSSLGITWSPTPVTHEGPSLLQSQEALMDDTGKSALGPRLISHAGEEFDPEWPGDGVFKGRNHSPVIQKGHRKFRKSRDGHKGSTPRPSQDYSQDYNLTLSSASSWNTVTELADPRFLILLFLLRFLAIFFLLGGSGFIQVFHYYNHAFGF